MLAVCTRVRWATGALLLVSCGAPVDLDGSDAGMGDSGATAGDAGQDAGTGGTGDTNSATGETTVHADGSTTDAGHMCLVDGVALELGDAATFYDTAEAPFGDSCRAHARVRTCTETGLDGDDAYALAECTESQTLHVFVQTDGDDRNGGLSEAQAVASLARGIEVVDSWAGAYQDATVSVGAGRFEHLGELLLSHPVTLVGASAAATTLAFAINRDQASVRVLSSSVSIADLEIEVDLIESLSDGIHTGGRGEYGTAITVGRYLHTEPHEVVADVSIHDIVIRRTNFTAAGITLIGRASDVDIAGVEIFGRVSTAVIVHWGGHSTVAPSPAALEDPRYGVLTSYHPHDLSIDGVLVHDSARLAVVSSAYNVTMRNFSGPASTMLFVLPGDEIDRFATPQDQGLVMSNLSFQNFSSDLEADEGEHVVRMTSVGTSRVDGLRRTLEFGAVSLTDFEVLSVSRPDGLSYRYGINANGTRGSQILLQDIDLADVASWEYDDGGTTQASFGVYLRDAAGVSVDGLSTQARYGVGILDSQDVMVDNATLTYTDEPPSSANAFGVYVAENAAPMGGNENLAIHNSTITGYDYGVRYLDNPGGPQTGCETLVVDNVDFVNVGQESLCVIP